MEKRIFSVLVALAVGVGLCSVCSMMAFAEGTYLPPRAMQQALPPLQSSAVAHGILSA